jgi:hypothetical protein
MLTLAGTYTNGQVELATLPETITSSPVLVTFLDSAEVDLQSLGIDQAQAAELRAQFAAFADWNDPQMDIYNDYDAAKSALDAKL